MSAGCNKRPIIASKCLDASYDDMEKAINECLEALNMDKIDIFKMHEVRQNPDWDYRSGAAVPYGLQIKGRY